MTIEALDLAQQFQTPVFVATDLDLGMNLWLSDPFPYPNKPIQRGKVLDAEDLERAGQFERYRDVDGDGVCYRTIPGTEHPLAAYFTRGTGHNEKSGYSERPEDWKKNLDRLARKLETARQALPAPVIDDVLGRTGRPDRLRRHPLGDRRGPRPAPRARACRRATAASGPCRSPTRSIRFIERHQRVYVVEQNRDAQVATLLKATLSGALADRLVPVTHYNGTPIAAENIVRPDPRLGEEPLRARLAHRRTSSATIRQSSPRRGRSLLRTDSGHRQLSESDQHSPEVCLSRRSNHGQRSDDLGPEQRPYPHAADPGLSGAALDALQGVRPQQHHQLPDRGVQVGRRQPVLRR